MLLLVGDLTDGGAIPQSHPHTSASPTPGESASPTANHTPKHTSDMAAWAGGREEKDRKKPRCQ